MASERLEAEADVALFSFSFSQNATERKSDT